uniref:NADH-ubiquinone oxidoreductase chain 2 n=1 Tax=Hemerobius spodipennis TaxID=2775101 RepID=A0A7L7YXW4_9NEOP|nr:NADH dehydrogenase subunit 2 [Hemerobius spodipennis]QOD41865.1 NADH dehydrogenase subunit 2 [Hemerobius spodipennis]
MSNTAFSFMLLMGTIISISSNSWLGAWMGLEINLLSFIPLLINLKNSLSTESALKYFLTQALASSILLFSIMLLSLEDICIESSILNWILNSALMLKMGAAPFHFWFPEMMEGLSWSMSFILMTWQKIAPMILISYCLIYNYSLIISILSIIIGSIGGINQTSIRKMMAYSSINHLGWLLSSLIISIYFWMIYFMIYTFILFSMILLFNKYNLFFTKQLYSVNNYNPVLKMLIFSNMLSLGGLPPFTGFLPKWLIIQSLSDSNLFLISIMVIFTLITLFYYIRMIYSALMINYTQLKWIYFNELNMNLILIMNFLSLMGLPLISLFYLIF